MIIPQNMFFDENTLKQNPKGEENKSAAQIPP